MFESKINRGRANGYAPLDGSGKVPLDNWMDGYGMPNPGIIWYWVR